MAVSVFFFLRLIASKADWFEPFSKRSIMGSWKKNGYATARFELATARFAGRSPASDYIVSLSPREWQLKTSPRSNSKLITSIIGARVDISQCSKQTPLQSRINKQTKTNNNKVHEEGGGVESFHRHTAVVVVVPTFVVFVIENVNKHFQSLLRGARTKTKTNKPLGVLAGVGANKLCSYSGEGTNRFQIIPNFEALFVHLPAGEIFLFVDLATLNYLIFNELWFSMHYFCSGFHN